MNGKGVGNPSLAATSQPRPPRRPTRNNHRRSTTTYTGRGRGGRSGRGARYSSSPGRGRPPRGPDSPRRTIPGNPPPSTTTSHTTLGRTIRNLPTTISLRMTTGITGRRFLGLRRLRLLPNPLPPPSLPRNRSHSGRDRRPCSLQRMQPLLWQQPQRLLAGRSSRRPLRGPSRNLALRILRIPLNPPSLPLNLPQSRGLRARGNDPTRPSRSERCSLRLSYLRSHPPRRSRSLRFPLRIRVRVSRGNGLACRPLRSRNWCRSSKR